MKINIGFYIFKLIWILNLSFNKQFSFLEQFFRKSILQVENTKNYSNNWILHIWLSLSTSLQPKLTVAIFWINLPKKSTYLQSKTDKIDTTIEFCIFELVFVSDFTLKKQFWIFGANFPRKHIYGQKQKNWTPSWNSAYSN